jgi:hypothetical protein
MEYYYQKQVLPAGKSISDAAGDLSGLVVMVKAKAKGEMGDGGKRHAEKKNVDIVSYFSSL